MGLPVLVMLMVLGGQESAPAAPPAPDPPVSVENIREGLKRPRLQIPAIDSTPVFRGSVVVDLPLDSPLEAARRELAADSGYRGGRGFDILGAVTGIVKSIKAARRAHTEAEIRKDVQAALNAFCAEHDCSVLESGPPPMEGIVLPRKRPTQ